MSKRRSFKEKCIDSFESEHEKMCARNRAQWLHSWMQICNVTRAEDIDYDNPDVHIQWLLTDPVNLMKLTDKSFGREWFFTLLTPEEQEVYLTPDVDGRSYAELEKGKMDVVMKNQIRKLKKRKNAELHQ